MFARRKGVGKNILWIDLSNILVEKYFLIDFFSQNRVEAMAVWKPKLIGDKAYTNCCYLSYTYTYPSYLLAIEEKDWAKISHILVKNNYSIEFLNSII